MTKQVRIDQDIGFYRGFFNEKLCKDIIAFYEENKKTQLTKLNLENLYLLTQRN